MADEKDIIAKNLGNPSDEEDDNNTASANQHGMRKNYLICIGIGKYKLKELNTLGDSCKNDCEDLKEILESDFSFETVKGVYDRAGTKINDDEQVLIDDKAIKSNIENLFKSLTYHPDFKPDQKKVGLPSHNLMIYYSGHGDAVGADGLDLFYFVPHDYEGPLDPCDPTDLYSVYNDLIPGIRNIRFHSVVLIIDACRSAATFNLTDWFKNPLATSTGDERCAWALCSSAKNEDSYLVNGERNSFFTKNLLEKLNNPEEIKIKLEQLGFDLKGQLRSMDQTVYSSRLQLIPDNAGDFYFIGNEKRGKKQVVNERKKYLEKHVYRMNYTPQRISIKKWYSCFKDSTTIWANPYLFFLSTTPQYGLKLAHRQICVSNSFPVKDYIKYSEEDPYKLNSLQYLNADKLSVLEIISSFVDRKAGQYGGGFPIPSPVLKTDDATQFNKKKEALIGKLLKMLNTDPVILKFGIDREQIVPKAKEDFLKVLHGLLAELELKVEVKHPFCVLILDADGSDYEELAKQFIEGTLPKYIMPKVADMDNIAFDDWYDEVVRDMDIKESKKYNELFKEIIDAMKKEFLNNGPCPPGQFIEALCEKSGCKELAFKILNF